jgi:hypothetical protein
MEGIYWGLRRRCELGSFMTRRSGHICSHRVSLYDQLRVLLCLQLDPKVALRLLLYSVPTPAETCRHAALIPSSESRDHRPWGSFRERSIR